MAREATSKRIARIAGRILNAEAWDIAGIKWGDIRALAASCLTQREDDGTPHGKVKAAQALAATTRPKRKRRARRG